MDNSEQREELRALARDWFEQVWNQRRAGAIDAMMAPDAVSYGFSFEETTKTGLAEFRSLYDQMIRAFPDIKIEVLQVIVDGDRTATRYLAYGTHLGDIDGLLATGNKFRFEGMKFARWKDGKVVESWSRHDQLGLLQQIGFLKRP